MKRVLHLLALVALLGCPSLKAAPRNIVFILTDDHRFDAMGFAGHPFLETPHMDSIARNGVPVHVHGVWDLDELYDLEKDPGETTNLVFSAEHQAIVREMNGKLFARLKETDGMFIPLQPDRGGSSNLRREAGSKPAEFPRELMRKKDRNN